MTCVKVELSRQNQKAGVTLFAMNKITQTMRFRQAVIEYSNKHGVTAAAIRYRLNRQYIYRWRKRYDGTLQSLADLSHRPHHHPNQHTPEESKLILNMRRRKPEHRDRCAVGQAQTKRLHPIYFWAVSFPAKTWRYGRKTAEPQIYPQTL